MFIFVWLYVMKFCIHVLFNYRYVRNYVVKYRTIGVIKYTIYIFYYNGFTSNGWPFRDPRSLYLYLFCFTKVPGPYNHFPSSLLFVIFYEHVIRFSDILTYFFYSSSHYQNFMDRLLYYKLVSRLPYRLGNL